jgi:hypothetical protein
VPVGGDGSEVLEVLPEEGDPCFIRRDLKEESQVHLYNRPFVVGDLHHSRSSRRQTRGPG